MFHFTSIEADDTFQGFRISWQKNAIDVYIAGQIHRTDFADAAGHAYEMLGNLKSFEQFMPPDDAALHYPRLYLKAFEEYAQIRMALEEQTEPNQPITLDL